MAFDRAGVTDRVTSESHATQLARAREFGDAAEEERLLLNPLSEHIGPAAKHRWEDRSPELKPDRVVEYEEASAAAREARSAHARDAADAALDAAESDDTRLGRPRDVLSDEAAEARFRRELGRRGGRFGTADLDDALATAERDQEERRQAEAAQRKRAATGRRVSRLERLFNSPGGGEAFFAALDDENPSWRRTGTRPSDIDRALDVAERGRDLDAPTPWRHRLVLEAERTFPGAASTAWRDAGAGFNRSTVTGRQAGTVSQTLSDRARARALAAERPEPPASRGLVKRLFAWLRERLQKMLGGLRPSRAAHHQERSAGGDVEAAWSVAAERAGREWRQAGMLITAAQAAAREWGDIPLATEPSSLLPSRSGPGRRRRRLSGRSSSRSTGRRHPWSVARPRRSD